MRSKVFPLFDIEGYLAIILLVFTLAFNSCKNEGTTQPQVNQEAAQPQNNNVSYIFSETASKSLKVCVYLDDGVFATCKVNTIYMLDRMHCAYTPVNKDSIINGSLNHYRLLIMPGGDMWLYNSYLSSNGKNAIKNFVNQGGGYIGICGGSYFAARQIVWRGWADEPRSYNSFSGLGLVNAVADGPIDDFAPYYVANACKINLINKNLPIMNYLPDTNDLYYNHGPMFLFIESPWITTIGRTATGNKSVMVEAKYGLGKVFLTAVHPEVNSTRTSLIMFKNAIEWCAQ